MSRLVRWHMASDPEGERVEMEADPRHVEILSSQAGFRIAESSAVTTPGVKNSPDSEEGPELGAEERALYRSMVMKAAYLSQDSGYPIRSQGASEEDGEADSTGPG